MQDDDSPMQDAEKELERVAKELKRLRDAHEVVQAEVKRYKTSTSRVVDEYVCPITHQLPVDPVLAEDGTVYDRRSIAEWIDKNKITDRTGKTFVKSPMSNANMGIKLTEMRLVRNTIQDLVDGNVVDDETAAAVLKQRVVKEAAEAGDPEAMYTMGVEAFDRAFDLLEGEAKIEAYKCNDWFRRGAAVHDQKCIATEGSHLYRGFEPWLPNMPSGHDRVQRLHGLVYIARAADQVDLAAYCMALGYINGELGHLYFENGFTRSDPNHPFNVALAKHWLDKALGDEIKHKIMSEHDRFEAEEQLKRTERLEKKFEEQKQYVGEYRGEGVGKGKRVYPNGSVYEGDFTDGVRHGQGKMVYTDGNIYDGEWKRDATHGRGKLVYAEGGYYEGNFFNNEPEGRGKLYRDGNFYEGKWYPGMTHGQGKIVYSDGNVYEGEWFRNKAYGNGKIVYAHGVHHYYEGSFENDVPRGEGKMVYENGNVYEGGWNQGMAHGQGKMVYSDGNVYEGEWVGNKAHGKGKIVYAHGGHYEGSFENDVPHGDGHGKLHYASGGYYEGELNRGVPHGQGKMVYADGNVYEGSWDNGRAHGLGKIVYAHGGRYEGSFENDVPRGEGKMVYQNGNVYVGAWNRGMANGYGRLHCTDGVYYEGNFENNEPQGQGKQVFKAIPNFNGVSYEYEGEMNKGKKHGRGKLICGDACYEGKWKNDKMYGGVKKTLANGEVDISWWFADGLTEDMGVKWSQDGKRAWALQHGLHHSPPKRLALRTAAQISARFGFPVPT